MRTKKQERGKFLKRSRGAKEHTCYFCIIGASKMRGSKALLQCYYTQECLPIYIYVASITATTCNLPIYLSRSANDFSIFLFDSLSRTFRSFSTRISLRSAGGRVRGPQRNSSIRRTGPNRTKNIGLLFVIMWGLAADLLVLLLLVVGI